MQMNSLLKIVSLLVADPRQEAAVDPGLPCSPPHGGLLHLKASGVVRVTSERSAVNNVVCQGASTVPLYKQYAL